MDLTSITPDLGGLKALGHPVRLRMLGMLRNDGPATSTTLAQRLGLNTGATSYHLRQLEKHGFIAEDPERGNNRDRWWRAAHQSTRFDASDLATPEEYETYDALQQAIAVVHTESLQRAVEEFSQLPEPWRVATGLSDWGITLTPERARRLMDALGELLDEWDEDDADTESAADFQVQLHGFPHPGRVARPEGP